MRLLKADIAWGGKVVFLARGPNRNGNHNTKERCAVPLMSLDAKKSEIASHNENNFCDFCQLMRDGKVDMRFCSIILSSLHFNLSLMTESINA